MKKNIKERRREKFKMNKVSKTNYDFCGWATRNNLKCSDGRTIREGAFADCDGKIVPLVWMHEHNNPENVLGHALLENRPGEGVFTYALFNNSDQGVNSKELVCHGDVDSLSIWANKLKQKGGDVLHGVIREVSLVLSGANPGAYITDIPGFEHSDDGEDSFEAIICTGMELELEHSEEEPSTEEKKEEDVVEHSDTKASEPEEPKKEEKMAENKGSDKTVQDVFDSMTEEQQNVVYFLIGQALEDAGVSGEGEEGGDPEDMKHNVFQNDTPDMILSHDDMDTILKDAKKCGSLKEAVEANLEDGVLAHANYGIENIDILFPDARAINEVPDFISREMGWVQTVMAGTHHTPFSRVKSMHANITADEARARGYIKGKKKKEEVFTLLKRSTDPQTVYKKQKIDRDDKLDITGFDVIAWIKGEMRMMLDEELARAILIGDGRNAADDDHISTDHIRPVVSDDSLYTVKAAVEVKANATADDRAKAFIRAAVKSRKEYKGTGSPTLFTTEDFLSDMLLLEDAMGHRLYGTEAELATAMRVSKIVTVPVMEGLKVSGMKTYEGTEIAGEKEIAGIIVNLTDYNVGADKGGEVNMFDDFDIDYNQEKYLIETRISGALVKPFSAITLYINESAGE